MGKWKDRLLSSGAMLEFEIANILVEKEFAISFDYTYRRQDEQEEKEFSVDIHADGYFPFKWESPIQQTIDFLIECKYRNPNVKWLFLPDINKDEYRIKSKWGAVKFIDEFSSYSFDQPIPFPYSNINCLKGMELNFQSGEVYESNILHGSYQLLYALPHLLFNKVYFSLHNSHLDELYPYVLCPILVTTADIFVLKDECTIEIFNQISDFEEICYKVDCVNLTISTPSSFDLHCSNIFNYQSLIKSSENYEHLKDLRALTPKGIEKGQFVTQPDALLYSLSHGASKNLFREIIVCNRAYFPHLIDKVKHFIGLIDKSKKKLTSTKKNRI